MDKDVIIKTLNRLPHWQMDGKIYFVTFRLGDSLAQETLKEIDREIESAVTGKAALTAKEVRRIEKYQQYLDRGAGSCILADQEIQQRLMEIFLARDGADYHIYSLVIMPNHIHMLFRILASECTLEKLLQYWKGKTGFFLKKKFPAMRKIWRKDYFDRIIRSQKHFEFCVSYIRNNPHKANLVAEKFLLWECEELKGEK